MTHHTFSRVVTHTLEVCRQDQRNDAWYAINTPATPRKRLRLKSAASIDGRSVWVSCVNIRTSRDANLVTDELRVAWSGLSRLTPLSEGSGSCHMVLSLQSVPTQQKPNAFIHLLRYLLPPGDIFGYFSVRMRV